jgi:multiple sugar transport system substrate-binding protein
MWHSIRKVTGRIILVIGVLCTTGLLVFVRPKDDTPNDRIVLHLWRAIGAEEVEPVVPQWFNESQDKIYVKTISLPFIEIEQKFLTSAVGNFPPDLFEYFGSVAQWSTRGALLPLDGFIERDSFDRSSVFAALWNDMMWDGRTYAIPTGAGDEAFYWNKDHFRKAGLDPEHPPATWKELEEYALKLTTYAKDGSIEQAGYIPGYWSPFPTALFLTWAIQKGAKFVSEDGTRVILTAPANIEALEWEGKLFEKLGREKLIFKRASFGYGSQQGFLSGQLSMICQKSSFVQEIEKFAPDLNYGVAPFPIPAGGKRVVMAGPVWIGIPSGARNPEAAWEYIKFCTRSDIQIRSAKYMAEKKHAAFFPANIEAAKSPFQMSLPHMDVFVDNMQWGHTFTVLPLAHTQFWRAYQVAWDSVMRGDKTAKEALKQAEVTVQEALDEQLAYNAFYREYLKKQGKHL